MKNLFFIALACLSMSAMAGSPGVLCQVSSKTTQNFIFNLNYGNFHGHHVGLLRGSFFAFGNSLYSGTTGQYTPPGLVDIIYMGEDMTNYDSVIALKKLPPENNLQVFAIQISVYNKTWYFKDDIYVGKCKGYLWW